MEGVKGVVTVAEFDGCIVESALGHERFSAYESCLGYFEWIAVSKEHQRAGNRKLCEEILKRLGDMGVSTSNPT